VRSINTQDLKELMGEVDRAKNLEDIEEKNKILDFIRFSLMAYLNLFKGK